LFILEIITWHPQGWEDHEVTKHSNERAATYFNILPENSASETEEDYCTRKLCYLMLPLGLFCRIKVARAGVLPTVQKTSVLYNVINDLPLLTFCELFCKSAAAAHKILVGKHKR
jgi:hypothetical protein